eukprot:jgi/Tetstr1/440682/TSEL_028990.t1
MEHMPAEMSMETAVPIDFQELWAEAQRCVNERVVMAAMEADDPVVLDRALKWKYLRRMTELMRSWDDARTEALHAEHARQRRMDAGLFAALLVGTADTVVVALVEDGQLSRAAGRVSSKALGPAAVRAMSEVASMYLQGRLHPGCFNLLFASARPVALVKKLGEGGGPDLRLVAVGEAERLRAERAAVVGNMKEAYVSVVPAPSQLGVGISAGHSVLIHGVRLIAEKLGPRTVIVHTDLRNAYNEAWRRTIIQCHVDCSSLRTVIPALLASLFTDSFLLVDYRSAPQRSEDGVRQGPPLATTSLCVAIHPEVQDRDNTLEASVGLEVRFDKMHAYIADMEAARCGAPANIEWPELNGCHGIPVLNVPLKFPWFVHAYMCGKAEELQEEVDAILSKLVSVKPSHRWMIAEAVAATVMTAVERVLEVSFDRSTYCTDTNPVVPDFLAELLHDPDPMAAEAATLSEADAVAKARNMLHLPTWLKGAGISAACMATVRDAAFIGCMNDILPRLLMKNSDTNTPTLGSFDPQLESVIGRGSCNNATSCARRYDIFFNDSRGSAGYAAAHNPVIVDLYGDTLMSLSAP